jgi:large conductance mechanosensitive channel
MLKGFKDFIMRGSIVELAVAVVIGAAFGQVVGSFVGDVLMPIIGLLGGVPDFSALKIGPILIGKFINAVVTFVIVAAAIYFIVVVPINRLKKKQEAAVPPSEPSEEVKLLTAILEELRRKS